MPRCLIVAELATAHGGCVDLAADMIWAAADAGADLAKLQSYTLASLNTADPQAAWLRQSHLDQAAHERLLQVGQAVGIEVFSTPFDAESLQMLRALGLKRFKIASSESGNDWWIGTQADEDWIVSWPWGARPRIFPHFKMLTVETRHLKLTHLTAIPLYPTPLEAVGRAMLLDGWSDHGEGIAACQWAIAQGAKLVEVHFTIPGARVKPWDKTAEQVRALRDFSEACETMRSGVSEVFRTRWRRA